MLFKWCMGFQRKSISSRENQKIIYPKVQIIPYEPIGPEHQPIVDAIHDFMSKLFPIEELREYMWNHLASTLLGTPGNQTFNNYLGGGRNGKSVLVTLMTKVLGDYKADLPLTAYCDTKKN